MIAELYDAYFKELTRWCQSMTGNPGLAEELVQEAFFRAMLNEEILAGLKEEQRKAWLYRVIKNIYVDHVRHGAYESIVEAVPERMVENIALTEFEWQQLLDSLPDMEGVLFAMRYLQGYNSRQLGELFQMPPGTVRSKLSSARKHLRDAIGGKRYA